MQKTILNPAATRALVPRLDQTRNPNVWVYRYIGPHGWRLSIATHAEPGSRKLSLGGFRIAPEERTSAPGFDSDIEAIELAMGMEDKVHWSRLVRIGGPFARRDMARIVGGKCVLHPTPDARVGQPRDRELLDFATACLRDCDTTAGIHITTGQDLGHGLMSDGTTQSLAYLHRGFRGSVVADTSRPTAEGNYYVLLGMLRAFGISVEDATVGLIGCGNIGMHIAHRLRAHETTLVAVERNEGRRAELERLSIRAWATDQKSDFLVQPMDALVLNASGASLTTDAVRIASANPRLRVICGSENLVMPDPANAELFSKAGKAYCPTEFGGMMGYLTAVEQYLCDIEGHPFDIATMMSTASELEEVAYRVTKSLIEKGFDRCFEQAVEALFGNEA